MLRIFPTLLRTRLRPRAGRSGFVPGYLCGLLILLALAGAPRAQTTPAGNAAEPEPVPPGAGQADRTEPVIDVYTMGPGDDLFSRFGHAAICVTDAKSPLGRCYNYGTADFSTPGPLTWSFLRGRAQFWVSVVPQPHMIAVYAREDRTLWRQRLPLPPETARRLAQRLHAADVREATFYLYHHFNDNCTTRIRDLIDEATDGALRQGAMVPSDPPLRRYVHAGFAGQPLLLILTDLLLGRPSDRPTTRWQGMFLPELLRRELESRFAAPPVVMYARQRPLPIGSSLGGAWILVPAGLLLLAAVHLARRRPGLAKGLVGIGLGFFGLLVSGLAACAALPELRQNEALLICLPTDLLLLFLPVRWAAAYARLRLVGLLAGAVAVTAGLLIQPLWPLLLFCALPLVGISRLRVGVKS